MAQECNEAAASDEIGQMENTLCLDEKLHFITVLALPEAIASA